MSCFIRVYYNFCRALWINWVKTLPTDQAPLRNRMVAFGFIGGLTVVADADR
jgi:hypothetical protein